MYDIVGVILIAVSILVLVTIVFTVWRHHEIEEQRWMSQLRKIEGDHDKILFMLQAVDEKCKKLMEK